MLLLDLIDALESKEAADGSALPWPRAAGPALPPFLAPRIVPWPQEMRPPAFAAPALWPPVAPPRPPGLIDLLDRDFSDEMPDQGSAMGRQTPASPDRANPPLPEFPAWWRTGEEVRAMPAGQRIGPIADTLQNHIPIEALARASLAPDIATQIKRLSEQTGLPERRFGVIDGRIVYGDSTGQIHYAVPSFAGADRSQGVFDYVGDLLLRGSRYLASKAGSAIPTVAGGVAGGALMQTPALSIPAAGAAASAADLGRQWLDKFLADEPLMTTDYDWTSAGGYGLQGMAGQGLALGANAAIQSGPVLPQFVGWAGTRAARMSGNPYFNREREERHRSEYERRASAGARQ